MFLVVVHFGGCAHLPTLFLEMVGSSLEKAEGLAKILINIAEFGATDFEKKFMASPGEGVHKWMLDNPSVPITAVVGYLIFCYFGSKIMESRKPFGLNYLLALWNFSLSLFSFMGMFRTVPYLIAELLTLSYRETICLNALNTYGNGPVGFWTLLFILSKFPELIDTVFIVIRKRPLIFLHWYHHVTVLLYCWHAYCVMAGSGIWFVAMNYSVHAIMYFYFMMQALKCVPKGDTSLLSFRFFSDTTLLSFHFPFPLSFI